MANSTEATLQALRKDERRLAALSGIVLAAMLGAVEFLKPGHTPFLPECLFHRFTGFLCPGCGTTRALYLLLHGQPLGALRENGLAVLLLPVLIHDLAAMISARWRPLGVRLSGKQIWILLLVIVLFAVARNLPMAPFIYLRPMSIP